MNKNKLYLVTLILGATSNLCFAGNTIPNTDIQFINGFEGTVKLNDTGVLMGGDYPTGNNMTCTSNIGANQDCHYGRDAIINDDSDGHAGFSFKKIANDGMVLPASAANWSCVLDSVTGLMWEVKTDDNGIHDKDFIYKWGGISHLGTGFGVYNSDWDDLITVSNGGSFGSISPFLCGYSDWRIPTISELQSIVDYSQVNPSIDLNYFPNTVSSFYWSATPTSNDATKAMMVFFNSGFISSGSRTFRTHVRLVRSEF